MPLTAKSNRNIYYRARLDGLRVRECIAFIDALYGRLGGPAPSPVSLNFDLPDQTFLGTLEEARGVFAEGVQELFNHATLELPSPEGPSFGLTTVSISVFQGWVSVTFAPTASESADLVIHLAKQAFPPEFGSADAEQQRLREVRMSAEQLVRDAETLHGATVEASSRGEAMASMLTDLESRTSAAAGQQAQVAEYRDAVAANSTAIAELLAQAQAANQDIAEKQVLFTAAVNSAAALQARIEAAEEKARTTVADVQDRSSAAVVDLTARTTAALNQMTEESVSLTSRTRGEVEAMLAEVRTRATAQADENSAHTKELLATNVELQAEVRTLLQGANAGQLHFAFMKRKHELEATQWRWLLGVIVNTILVVGAGIWLVHDLAAVKGSDLALIAVKVSIILPLAVLDVFLATQYTNRRTLIEEYSFKASMCSSLIHFKDLVQSLTAEEATLQFVLDAVNRIYTNPSDAIARTGPATKQVSRAMKTLQDMGIVDLLKNAANTAKP